MYIHVVPPTFISTVYTCSYVDPIYLFTVKFPTQMFLFFAYVHRPNFYDVEQNVFNGKYLRKEIKQILGLETL